MNAENPKAERVLKLLLESFPEHPRSEGASLPIPPETLGPGDAALLSVLATEPFEHGISELSSPLSE